MKEVSHDSPAPPFSTTENTARPLAQCSVRGRAAGPRSAGPRQSSGFQQPARCRCVSQRGVCACGSQISRHKNFTRRASQVARSSFQGNNFNFALSHLANAREIPRSAAPRLTREISCYMWVVSILQFTEFWLPGQAVSPQASYVTSRCSHFLMHTMGQLDSDSQKYPSPRTRRYELRSAQSWSPCR